MGKRFLAFFFMPYKLIPVANLGKLCTFFCASQKQIYRFRHYFHTLTNIELLKNHSKKTTCELLIRIYSNNEMFTMFKENSWILKILVAL